MTLNNAQNNYLTNEINKSDNIKDITNIVDNASSLNDAMKDLRDTVAQLNQSTKDSINYQNADEDLKLQFDNAINIKDGDNLDITVIEGMTQAIKDAKDALNGEQRLKMLNKLHIKLLTMHLNINLMKSIMLMLQMNQKHKLLNL